MSIFGVYDNCYDDMKSKKKNKAVHLILIKTGGI